MFKMTPAAALSRFGLGLAVSLVAIATAPGAQAQPNGQASQNDYNYVGSGISDEGFIINGKARLNPNLSLRPTVILDYDFDDATVLVPVTYDFPSIEAAGADLLPFGGAGVRLATHGDDNFGALITGGVDYRFAEKWTANASVNVSFIDEADLDLTAGVGYTF